MTLAETFGFLRAMHRSAPFLFFNGNTFAELGRQLVPVVFADLSPLAIVNQNEFKQRYRLTPLPWPLAGEN